MITAPQERAPAINLHKAAGTQWALKTSKHLGLPRDLRAESEVSGREGVLCAL